MKADLPVVVVVDDDVDVLKSLTRLLAAHDYEVRTYQHAEEFFLAGPPKVPGCLLLDQHLGSVKGTDVHVEMQRLGWNIPTVFLTADWDTHTVVDAMRGGAENYITKPYNPEELLLAVDRALQQGFAASLQRANEVDLRQRAALLTPRERAIISLVAKGMLNKQIADYLQLAVVTVKLHRGRAMQKLRANNAAELGRIAMQLGL